MAELNFKQITDKLNNEFTGDTRRIVFWYDSNAEFEEDIDSLSLVNAEILKLNTNNQFKVKHFLECEDQTTNYLVYAPFEKPSIRENHLADTIRYSKEFFADRTSLLCLDLGIGERYKNVIQKHIKFFNNKERTQAFYDLDIEEYNTNIIETALMSVLCKSKVVSFEEVVRCILTEGDFEDNKILAEFEKYDLIECFWRHCEETFGFTDENPTLEKLVMTIFATYASKEMHTEAPKPWQPFVSYKSGSITTFIDNLMNNVLYSDNFDSLSEKMYIALNAETVLGSLEPDVLSDCSIFAGIDDIIIKWIIGRIEEEDVSARLDEKDISQICEARRKMHFGKAYFNEYCVLENAYRMIMPDIYTQTSSLKLIAENYIEKDYKVDSTYRKFYLHYDKLSDTGAFEKIRDNVENIYTNAFLNSITANWSMTFVADEGRTKLDSQLEFYKKYVEYRKERVVVIISDALRYETGKELYERLLLDEKCDVKISAMQSVLPAITRFGMAALLPHQEVTIDNSYNVLCDGKPCADLKQRDAILKAADSASACVKFDDLKNMKQAEIRPIFTGKNVVYIYHDQIDARGEQTASENEVFNACEEAVEEIYALIKKINSQANTYSFIVTSDHGFIYKRDPVTESDKISGISNNGRRYAISDSKFEKTGVATIPMNTYLPGDDDRYLLSPVGSDVFKAPGSGLNYVHGGCSPQEMIIPVIEVKTEKNKVATTSASIDLISPVNKITGLTVYLDFIQSEPVSDVIKETEYKIGFVDDEDKPISGESIYRADSMEEDSTKRVFRLKFSFKNQSYDKLKKYYLVVTDNKTGMETLRREVIVDLAFAGDFGFNV